MGSILLPEGPFTYCWRDWSLFGMLENGQYCPLKKKAIASRNRQNKTDARQGRELALY
jgi:hypothetical protein